MKIGKVDCTSNRNICERFGVQSYPTLKVIAKGKFYDYAGKRDADSMINFALKGYKVKCTMYVFFEDLHARTLKKSARRPNTRKRSCRQPSLVSSYSFKSSHHSSVLTGCESWNPAEVQKQAAASERAEIETKSSVVGITSASFETLVKEKTDTWMLKFYAPWCGHCKRLVSFGPASSDSLAVDVAQTQHGA